MFVPAGNATATSLPPPSHVQGNQTNLGLQKRLRWFFLPNLQILHRVAPHPGKVPRYDRGEAAAHCSLLLHPAGGDNPGSASNVARGLLE